MTKSKNAKELFEAGMMAFANTRYENSIDLFTQAIDNDPVYTLAFVSRGAAYLKQEMFDSARDDFDHAVKLNPGYARAYHLRGLVSEKRGDDHTALADFDQAIELNPEYGAAYHSRATLHAKMANTEKAQQDIEMMAHLANLNVESFMNENNVWRTGQMRVEDALETELER